MKKLDGMTSEEIQEYLRKSMPPNMYEAHAHCTNNRKELGTSKTCGCFYCLKIYTPDKVWEWMKTELEEFAMCPYCGIDSVIGDASGYPINPEFLKEMNQHWFKDDVSF